MRVIIAGSRHMTDYDYLDHVVTHVLNDLRLQHGDQPIEIITGGAKGADSLGHKWARLNGYPRKQFRAYWKKYKRAAGPKRNEKMAEYANADPHGVAVLIAFPGPASKGTKNMISIAKKRKYNIDVHIYDIPL